MVNGAYRQRRGYRAATGHTLRFDDCEILHTSQPYQIGKNDKDAGEMINIIQPGAHSAW